MPEKKRFGRPDADDVLDDDDEGFVDADEDIDMDDEPTDSEDMDDYLS